jgi:hypothetical protein
MLGRRRAGGGAPAVPSESSRLPKLQLAQRRRRRIMLHARDPAPKAPARALGPGVSSLSALAGGGSESLKFQWSKINLGRLHNARRGPATRGLLFQRA